MIGAIFRKSRTRFDKVLRLLDDERQLILNGPLSALPAVVEKRETMLTEILAGEAEPPESFVAALQSRAERNSRLLMASIAGLREADAQIERLRIASENLRTYTASGDAVDVKRPPVTREQRS